MLNKSFPEILKQFSIDYSKEYSKLKKLFYHEPAYTTQYRYPNVDSSLYSCCADNFINYPYRRTILSLAEFNSSFGFDFHNKEGEDIEDLIALCEYVFNLLFHIRIIEEAGDMKNFVLDYIRSLCDEMYCSLNQDEEGVFFIVKNDALIESLCSVVDEDIGIQLLKFTHHSTQSDVGFKKRVLLRIYEILEPERYKLNTKLTEIFFPYSNSCNIRHNNVGDGPKHKEYVSKMDDSQLIELYDNLFKVGLILLLEKNNLEVIDKLASEKGEACK